MKSALHVLPWQQHPGACGSQCGTTSAGSGTDLPCVSLETRPQAIPPPQVLVKKVCWTPLPSPVWVQDHCHATRGDAVLSQQERLTEALAEQNGAAEGFKMFTRPKQG